MDTASVVMLEGSEDFLTLIWLYRINIFYMYDIITYVSIKWPIDCIREPFKSDLLDNFI